MSVVASSSQRPKLVLGNWKLHGSLGANTALLQALQNDLSEHGGVAAGVVAGVLVPAPYLAQVQALLAGGALSWGAQDISAHSAGAYTGEVAGAMLAEFGCQYVLAGHSERRSYHGETSEQVAAKAQAALAVSITPVVCVGETLAERDAGQALAVIGAQLAPVLALGAEAVNRLVLAYEPVWAIGTGRTASPEQAQEVHAFIRAQLQTVGAQRVPVLYGGSVKAANAAELFAQPDVDGGLVGGAALDAAEFARIVRAAGAV